MRCDILISGSLKGRMFYHTVEHEMTGKNVPYLGWPGPVGGQDQTFCVGEEHSKPFVIYKKEVNGSCQAKGYVERSFRRHGSGDDKRIPAETTTPLKRTWVRPARLYPQRKKRNSHPRIISGNATHARKW